MTGHNDTAEAMADAVIRDEGLLLPLEYASQSEPETNSLTPVRLRCSGRPHLGFRCEAGTKGARLCISGPNGIDLRMPRTGFGPSLILDASALLDWHRLTDALPTPWCRQPRQLRETPDGWRLCFSHEQSCHRRRQGAALTRINMC